jgi:hypothetical protein
MNLAFSTVRQLRSAASQFLTWDMMVAHPEAAFMDQQRRVLAQPCRPTDGLSYYTLHASGMRARIGDQTHPSVALLDSHIRFFDAELNRAYLRSSNAHDRRQHALAGFANLLLWLGWLRSSEVFGLTWQDFQTIEPEDSAVLDLPVGCGMVSAQLGPETKSSRSHRPDVPMAYKSLSGFHLGKWFHRARQACGFGAAYRTSATFVFCQPDGTPWTSKYFRRRFLYPSLHRQRAAGDPYLRPFDGSPGNSIEAKFWSLHCYRRGAYEHGRWRRRRSGKAIDKIYQAWPLRDRLKITLYCM